MNPTSANFSSSRLRPELTHLTEDSLLTSASGAERRAHGEKPKIMLVVPPYTRMKSPAPAGSSLEEIGVTEFEVMKRAGTPIGLLRIAASAQQESNHGYDIRIVDAPFAGWEQEERFLDMQEGTLYRYGLTSEQLKTQIAEFEPDIVGIQCNYTVQWGNARELADLVKEIDPRIVVLGGGAHMSGDWQNAIVDAPFDAIVVNEADRSFPQVLKSLTGNGPRMEDLNGIVYREKGQGVKTQRSGYLSISPKQKLVDQEKIMPYPDFGLLDMSLYEQSSHSAGERVKSTGAWAQIFSTIGCNVGCAFCYIPMINGPWRALGLDWFDKHLQQIKHHGVTEVLLEDDHLLHDPQHAREVFKVLKKNDLPWVEEGGLSLFNLMVLHKGKSFLDSLPSFSAKEKAIYKNVVQAVADGLTAKQLIKEMAESGCYGAYLAVESANEESLVNSNKPKINAITQATAEIVELFAENGIQATGGFMLGFVNPPNKPGEAPYIESQGQMERTIDYARQLMQRGMAYANPFIVTPIPGTPMWEFQRSYCVRNYDSGWSHERATMATPSWSADDMDKMRLKLLVEANGKDRVLQMLQRSTWPVSRQN